MEDHWRMFLERQFKVNVNEKGNKGKGTNKISIGTKKIFRGKCNYKIHKKKVELLHNTEFFQHRIAVCFLSSAKNSIF